MSTAVARAFAASATGLPGENLFEMAREVERGEGGATAGGVV
jgi:hypothetical protein